MGGREEVKTLEAGMGEGTYFQYTSNFVLWDVNNVLKIDFYIFFFVPSSNF